VSELSNIDYSLIAADETGEGSSFFVAAGEAGSVLVLLKYNVSDIDFAQVTSMTVTTNAWKNVSNMSHGNARVSIWNGSTWDLIDSFNTLDTETYQTETYTGVDITNHVIDSYIYILLIIIALDPGELLCLDYAEILLDGISIGRAGYRGLHGITGPGISGPRGLTGPVGITGPTLWTQSGYDAYRQTGFIGIGTIPSYKLHVAGSFKQGATGSDVVGFFGSTPATWTGVSSLSTWTGVTSGANQVDLSDLNTKVQAIHNKVNEIVAALDRYGLV
jgi:hypothetical protein